MRRMWTRALLLGAMGLAGGSAVGCAQERAPINQVQADALAKSFFVGANLEDPSDDPEFYMRGTVVDVGYGAAQDGLFTSTYAQPVSRIKWEIQENYLNARLSYQRVANTDGKGDMTDGLIKKTSEDGQIVAAYKITSHFDIERSYNPTTGEQLNVVVENSTDRPWYQRQYFRVDWSQNLATDSYDFDTLTALGWIGGIEYEPLSYTVLDPNQPDAPHFDSANGYFDVTVKAFAKPAVIDLSSLGWGINQIPACMLPGEFAGGTQPYGNCNPMEITLRYSFKKVVDTDYVPVSYDGYRFQAFGIFTTERMGYARDYGITDQQWYRFASRYNIWERSHYYSDPATMTGSVPCATYATTEQATGDPSADPNRDLDGDGTADECAAVTKATNTGGSRCDVFSKKCTLPYQARKPVTIPWYINGAATETIDSIEAQLAVAKDASTIKTLKAELASAQSQGENLFEATNWAVQEWDLAMKTAIMTARQVECKRSGGIGCSTTFPMWVGQQDDNDEAVLITRDLDICRRQQASAGTNGMAITGDSTDIENARKKGWTSETCVSQAQAGAAGVASERHVDPNSDPSTVAMAAVIPMDPVIVLCHNPVIQSDHPSCGAIGLSPRLGDIRYNTVLDIPNPQTPSAWGIMVDGDDPLTGEKVAASINIWTAVTDIASQSLVDLVRYMNGELTTAQITNGTYISQWAQAAQLASDGRGPSMSRKQISQRLAAVAGTDTETYEAKVKAGLPAGIVGGIQQIHASKVRDIAVSSDVASPSAAGIQARFQAMHNSTTEATLINPAMLQRSGINGTIPQGAVADYASGVALNNPRVSSQLQQMRQNVMAGMGYCLIEEAPEASSLTGIADAMKRKFPRNAQTCGKPSDCASKQCTANTTGSTATTCVETAQESDTRYGNMVNYVRRRYHYAVLAHEMGHSVGLRHNFVSSYAALHFRPQYWQLRTANTKQTSPCTDAVNDGSTCTGPRYWDPLTEEEQSQMIWMFQQSSVMDYPGDVSQDTLGLGSYDFAAARMFYGDVTSVYNVQSDGHLNPAYLSSGQIGQGILTTTDNFGGLTGIQYQMGPIGTQTSSPPFHYSQLQKNYNVIDNCQTVSPKAPDWWNPAVDGAWDQVLDGKIVSVGGVPTKCRSLQVDYMGWNDLRMPLPAEFGNNLANYRGGNAVDNATKRVRVPYSFASDNWADTGNVSVFRHDNGADPYEQLMFLTTTQEDRHILDNFRRGRQTFNVRASSDRSYSRYNEKMLDIAGGIGFLANIYKDFSTSQFLTFESLFPYIIENNYKENMIAATLAMDHFTRELSRPESGAHYFVAAPIALPLGMQDNTMRSANDSDGNPGTTFVVIPEGSTGYLGIEMQPGVVGSIGFGGHLLENGLATNQGDYDVQYTENAGSYYEKINTAILLSLSEDRFISQSRQDFYDARFRSVGMADVLPNGWRRVIANALTGDRSLLAPQLAADGSGLPLLANKADPYDPTNKTALQYPAQPIGWTSWWPTEGPTPCFPKNGSNVCVSYTQGTEVTDPGFSPNTPGALVGIDPQIGWEVQKFIIAWTLAYIPADQQSNWLDMMRLYRLGLNASPSFPNRVEWEDPVSQEMFYAHTYGSECLFGPAGATDQATCMGADPINAPTGGRWVQQGIAARVLEYANFLTSQAYACDPTYVAPGYVCDPNTLPTPSTGFDPATGRFHFATMSDGTPVIRFDPQMVSLTAAGTGTAPPPTCDLDVPVDCDGSIFDTSSAMYCGVNKLHSVGCTAPATQWDNHWAPLVGSYKEVPDYLWEVVIRYNLGTPDELGVYPN